MSTRNKQNRGAQVHVVSLLPGDTPAPVALVILLHSAPQHVAIRFAGGCSEMDAETKGALQNYVVNAFTLVGGFRGVAMSGGTLESAAPTVCQIPVTLRKQFGCIAVSTTPRVGTMHLSDDRGLTVTDDAKIETRQDAAVIVQKNASDDAGWDGDLDTYFGHLELLRSSGGWRVALVAVNGGGVTKKEIKGALKRRIPVIVINGTGRAADAFSTEFRSGTFGSDYAELGSPGEFTNLVHIAEFESPETLAEGLRRFELAQA